MNSIILSSNLNTKVSTAYHFEGREGKALKKKNFLNANVLPILVSKHK